MKRIRKEVPLPPYEPGLPFYAPAQEVNGRPFMRVMPSPFPPFTLPAACTFIRTL